MGIVSGIPAIVNGVQVGATDFSEFTVGTGIPPGITQFGLGSDAPTTFFIRNDPIEGNYFEMSGQGVQGWAFGRDPFAGIIEFGEMLARVWIDLGTHDARTNLGPVFSLSGFIAQPEPGPDLDFSGGGMFRRVGPDYEAQAWSTRDGGAFIPVDEDIQEAKQDEVWHWVRVRRTENSGDPTRDDGEITCWYGDLSSEPATPNGSYTAQAPPNIRGLGALGWGIQQFGGPEIQRIAYLSYSGNPIVEAPPVPSEIDDPWAPAGNQLPITTAWTPSP